MDRPVQARLGAAKLRLRELTEEEEALLQRLQALREQRRKTEDEIKLCQTPVRRRVTGNTEEAWRRAARKLGAFTAAELATELGVTRATAKKHLNAMHEAGIVKDLGRRMFGSPMFEYLKPTEAGEAHEAQKRLRVVPDPEREAVSAPLRRQDVKHTSTGRGSIPKEIMPLIQEAQQRGWVLGSDGGKHDYYLKLGPHKVPVSGSPRDAIHTRNFLRQNLARYERLVADGKAS
jgi:DNA-binding transcriptional ArsR family regulator